MFPEMGRLQESHNSPRSKCSPSRPLNGLGTTMTVLPKLVKYTMSRGREAKVGSRSLCLQRKLSTSSANPRKIMQQMARRAPISCTNWAKNKSGESGVEVQRQVLNGRKMDKPRHEGSPYTGFLQSSWGKALEWSRRGWWGRLSHWLHPGTPGCERRHKETRWGKVQHKSNNCQR